MQPPLTSSPEGDWACPECTAAGRLCESLLQEEAANFALTDGGRNPMVVHRGGGGRGGGRGRGGGGRGSRGGGVAGGAAPGGGRGRGGRHSAHHSSFAGTLEAVDGGAYVGSPAALLAVGTALSGPVRLALAVHNDALSLQSTQGARGEGSRLAGTPIYNRSGLRDGGAAASGGGGDDDETVGDVAEAAAATAEVAAEVVHVISSEPGSEPQPSSSEGGAAVRVSFADVGVLGRFMQVRRSRRWM